MSIHKPVLLEESIEALNLKPGDTVVDATLGGGGHSREILKRILPGGKLIAVDSDQEAIEKFRGSLNNLESVREKENVFLVNDNFSRLEKILDSLRLNGIKKADAVLADLGISSDQLEGGRGFSFLKDAPLDMRISLRSTRLDLRRPQVDARRANLYESRNKELTAADVVNNYPEKDLVKILKEYGEEKFASSIAKRIISARKSKPIETTLELVEIINRAVPERYKHQKLHFATRTFQAFRMEVNRELENLKEFLPQAFEVLRSGGRIAVISFHSGEDRIVKNFFRENARGCVFLPAPQGKKLRTEPPDENIYGFCGQPKIRIITKKPVVPAEAEMKENPRSRSAKLRAAEKI